MIVTFEIGEVGWRGGLGWGGGGGGDGGHRGKRKKSRGGKETEKRNCCGRSFLLARFRDLSGHVDSRVARAC